MWYHNMNRMLKSADDINQSIIELSAVISSDYASTECLHLISLLNGGSVFCADLMRALAIPTAFSHFGFDSIPLELGEGQVRITLDVYDELRGKDILIVEGLVISGRTPLYLLNYFESRGPKSIEICAVGTKPRAREVELEVKYNLFEFEKEWVAGYGIGRGIERSKPYLFDANHSLSKK